VRFYWLVALMSLRIYQGEQSRTQDQGPNMPTVDVQLGDLERRFQDDGISYLMIQFVDIHGAAKVKLVPAKTLRAVAEVGAGFAGGRHLGDGTRPAFA
jgi:hypothetical protein